MIQHISKDTPELVTLEINLKFRYNVHSEKVRTHFQKSQFYSFPNRGWGGGKIEQNVKNFCVVVLGLMVCSIAILKSVIIF